MLLSLLLLENSAFPGIKGQRDCHFISMKLMNAHSWPGISPLSRANISCHSKVHSTAWPLLLLRSIHPIIKSVFPLMSWWQNTAMSVCLSKQADLWHTLNGFVTRFKNLRQGEIPKTKKELPGRVTGKNWYSYAHQPQKPYIIMFMNLTPKEHFSHI